MSKKVKLVYQDCPMCGARKNWGDAQLKIANTYGFEIEKTPFYSPGAEGLMWKALEAGITSYPFFTDGVKFSKNLKDFVEKPKKSRKKSKKVKESTEDGSVSED